MRYTILLALILSSQLSHGIDLPDHPKTPDASMTPGSLCTIPVRYRYPENIAYCDRFVDRELKEQVFQNYRRKGFSLSEPRNNYKIDHFIPLCAGGSNNLNNLWPQHSSVFSVTDELEGLGCSKLQTGAITQRVLVDLIKKVKLDNSKASEALKYLYSL